MFASGPMDFDLAMSFLTRLYQKKYTPEDIPTESRAAVIPLYRALIP
jgi:transposase